VRRRLGAVDSGILATIGLLTVTAAWGSTFVECRELLALRDPPD
jgi:hypothetical protein